MRRPNCEMADTRCMSRFGGAVGATTFDGGAALVAAAAEPHRATARCMIKIEHKTATTIGSLV
jgi:hypothetical protein